MQYVACETIPNLRKPVLIGAFKGWNDAAEVATSAVRYLVETWKAPRFASIDPEDFYDFQQTRPTVRIVEGSQRRIDWPANDFYYYCANERELRDYILFLGVEPQLKWRTYTTTLVDFAKQVGVTQVMFVGCLIADVAHSLPVRLSGSSNHPEIKDKLEALGITRSGYEGPTGIIGVGSEACTRGGLPVSSIWGAVPHYIPSTPNPKVLVAVLRNLRDVLNFDVELKQLESTVEPFEREVSRAVSRNPQLASYLRQLEAREAERRQIRPPSGELPSGDVVVAELEEFLRRRRRADGEEEG